MALFSPKLFKAASGAKVMPVSGKRTNEPFESPVYEDYLAKNDIGGYMTALWKGVAARDIESMRVLFFLSVEAEEPENAFALLKMLKEAGDDFGLAQVEFTLMIPRFGNNEPALLRAYITNVGREVEDATPEEEEQPEFKDCAPQDLKDEWRGLYHRDDCSANQMSIYNEALPYAKQGDPYAMFIVGYLLNRGIKTKYSNPPVIMLEVDHQKAATWLRRAAKAGIDKACWEAACALSEAWYVPDSNGENPEIRQFIEMGAKKNDPACLEWLFKNTKEDKERFEYLERLAEAYRTYQYEIELSEWLAEGKGCEKDEKRAYELADHVYRHTEVSPYDDSHEKAAKLLARYLENGIGCEPDPDRARDIRRGLSSDWDDMMELLSR